ncbi:MAG TPA: TonB family protein [Kofleriaceae bacterium]|nr:TonB family protein [Kofleriaceae bacterium]
MMRVSILIILLAAADAAADTPTFTFGRPTVQGSHAEREITTIVKRSMSELVACLQQGRVKDPGLDGTMVMSFTIAADGRVTAASSLEPNAAYRACLEATFTKLRFTRSRGSRKPTKVSLKLEASPSGYGTARGLCRHCDNVYRAAMSIGDPEINGELDVAVVRRYVKRYFQLLTSCYEPRLATNQAVEGTVVARFTIGVDGWVTAVTASGTSDAALDRCVADVVRGMKFPAPKHGVVEVRHPITFRRS